MKAIIITGTIFAAYVIWLAYELKRSPLVDEDGNPVEDKKKGGNRKAEEIAGGVVLVLAMTVFTWLCCVGSGYNWQ